MTYETRFRLNSLDFKYQRMFYAKKHFEVHVTEDELANLNSESALKTVDVQYKTVHFNEHRIVLLDSTPPGFISALLNSGQIQPTSDFYVSQRQKGTTIGSKTYSQGHLVCPGLGGHEDIAALNAACADPAEMLRIPYAVACPKEGQNPSWLSGYMSADHRTACRMEVDDFDDWLCTVSGPDEIKWDHLLWIQTLKPSMAPVLTWHGLPIFSYTKIRVVDQTALPFFTHEGQIIRGSQLTTGLMKGLLDNGAIVLTHSDSFKQHMKHVLQDVLGPKAGQLVEQFKVVKPFYSVVMGNMIPGHTFKADMVHPDNLTLWKAEGWIEPVDPFNYLKNPDGTVNATTVVNPAKASAPDGEGQHYVVKESFYWDGKWYTAGAMLMQKPHGMAEGHWVDKILSGAVVSVATPIGKVNTFGLFGKPQLQELDQDDDTLPWGLTR